MKYSSIDNRDRLIVVYTCDCAVSSISVVFTLVHFKMELIEDMGSISMHEKIHRRSGHIAVVHKDRMIVWGGYVVNITKGSRRIVKLLSGG